MAEVYRLCKQYVGDKIFEEIVIVQVLQYSKPATHKAYAYQYVTCATEYDSYCPLLYCFNLAGSFGIYSASDATQELRILAQA